MKTQTVHEGIFCPDQEKSGVFLPFNVPDDAVRIDVQYSYSHQIHSDPLLSGGNTIDLGIFDARGIAFLNAGFRGWTGSERLSAFITETEATPGYLPGPLIPGCWHVLLGLYKIAPEGCSYRVTIDITRDPHKQPTTELPQPVRSLPSSPPPAPFAPWLRGEMHCHTWHSDGDSSPADVVALARKRGLDFLAVTDHNSIASHRELAALKDPGLILILGVEVTTFKGHFTVWGTGQWVDFRVQSPENMAAALRFAASCGAVTSCAHPKPYGPPWDYTDVTNYDCIEVWNGPWFALNPVSLEKWTKEIGRGRRIPAVGGSDWHRHSQMNEEAPRAPGIPTMWAYVPHAPSAPAILHAIRCGHVCLSEQPEGPFLEFWAGEERAALGGDTVAAPQSGVLPLWVHCRGGAGQHLVLLDQRGVIVEQTISQQEAEIACAVSVTSSLFVRAELRADDDRLTAMTNPIYLIH